jgi:regulator of sirC expression with transglutaminase-like and TPR domain
MLCSRLAMNRNLIQAWSHTVGGNVPDADLDLAACSLTIAEIERPGLAAGAYLAKLDALAAGVRAAARPGEPLLDAAVRHLFSELGFRGNTESYYDPKNSCLDQVLDRRLGIPITLSVVVLEIGWRLGLPLGGIGFPGHFLVGGKSGDVERILDPFHGGATLDRAALEERLRQSLGPKAVMAPAHLRVVRKREILARMLNNLHGIYRRAGDGARVAEVSELLAVLAPTARNGPPRGAPN